MSLGNLFECDSGKKDLIKENGKNTFCPFLRFLIESCVISLTFPLESIL